MLIGAGLVATFNTTALAGEDHQEDHHNDNHGGDGHNDRENDDDDGESDDNGDTSPSQPALTTDSVGNNVPANDARLPKKGRLLNQDEVKQEIANGSASSLPLLLAFVQNKYPGEVLDVKLRALDGQFIYEVKLLSKFVFLRTVSLEAKTLRQM
jgi:uncharacterized membrane protein YkoI